MKNITISIIDSRKFTSYLRKLISSCAYLFAPVALGVYLDSAAMQWIGFVMGLIMMSVWAYNDPTKFTTIADARAYLDKLEREPE